MDAANAPKSLSPAPSESTAKTVAKEITDELHPDGIIKETSEHIDRLDVVVDLDLALRLSKLPTKRINFRPKTPLPSIFQLPKKLETTNYFFTPRVVSIGPYHHGKSCLAKMERHKSRFLEDFLSRDTSKSLEHYQNKLKKRLEESLKNEYYDVTGFDLTRDELVDIMILDGCFILEFLIKIYNHTPDEIFQNETLLWYIKTDLLMFENQVPLFVLEMLYEDPIPTIKELLAYYFWGTKDDPSMYENYLDPRSMLQFYNQLFILPRSDDGKVKYVYPQGSYWKIATENPVPVPYSSFRRQAPSVQQLEKAGAIFRAKRSEFFLDITFHEGVLEIPVLSMDEPFLLFFVNLAMFDLHVDCRFVMESYCRFMACLVRTSNDVDILRKHGIIESNFMTNQNWHDLFDRFGHFDDLRYDQHYFAYLFEDLWFFFARPDKKPYERLWRFVARIKYKIKCLWRWFLLLVMVFFFYVLPAILGVFTIFALVVVFGHYKHN